MKPTILLFALLLILCTVQAQVITLKINNNCGASILLDNKKLPVPNKIYDLSRNNDSVIRLVLDNPDNKKVLVVLKSLIAESTAELRLTKDNFISDNSISSDKNLNFKINGKAENFNIPFTIFFGCDDSAMRDKTVFNSFNPKIIVTTNVAEVSNQTNGVTVASSNLTPAEQAYNPGSAVYNALKLADSNTITENEFKAIIKLYFPDKDVSDPAHAVEAVSDNPFLNTIITESYLKSIIPAVGSRSAAEILSSFSLSSIGGLDVTNIADAFAKFIVKRTKQELNITFFNRFKEYISKYPDLRTVFPQTYNALSIIGDEIYNYQAYIQTLRESFEGDLRTLDKNLPTVIDNHPSFFNQRPELAATLNSGCYIAGALDDKVHPGDILQNYPANYLDGLNQNWKGAIQTLQLFSASLRDTATNTDSVYWVSARQVKKLVANTTAFKIYLGLIYQIEKNKSPNNQITFENNKTLLGFLNEVAITTAETEKNFQAYKSFIVNFSEKADKLNVMIKNYNKPANDSLAFKQYYNYFNSSIDLIQQCTEISNLPYIKNVVPNLSDTLKDYFDVAYSAGNMVLAINQRNYASAVTNAVHIYDVVKAKHPATKTNTKSEDKIEQQVKATVKKAYETDSLVTITQKEVSAPQETLAIDMNSVKQIAYDEATKEIIQKGSNDSNFKFEKDSIKKLVDNKISLIIAEKSKEDAINKAKELSLEATNSDDTLKKFYKYGTFMATVVQAKSSDDIENAIEAFALPTGSARIKRVSDFNVSLNAFAGLYIGREDIIGIKDEPFINTYGLTAPIGVAASWGHSLFFIPTGKHEWSTSVYVSLIDLGAVAAFRFKDTLTAQVPTIHLEDIFSPGVFLSIGIPKTPLSFNLGTQVGPNLRQVNKDGNDYSNNVYWRFSASICVDIPVINFYTKSR